MLIRFVVENFLSFREEVEFHLLAGSYKIHREHVHVAKKGVELLKVAAIYGANGSGKSNFVQAVDHARDLVLFGSDTAKSKLPHHFFKLDKQCQAKPTRFEFEFFHQNTLFAYGIAFHAQRIEEEWLYKTNPGKEDELVFERETSENGKTSLRLNPKLIKTQKDKYKVEIYAEEIAANQPFLTEANEKELGFAKQPYSWFENVLEVIFPDSEPEGIFENILFSENHQKITNQIINAVDTGVREINTQPIDFHQLFGIHESEEKEEILKWLDKREVYVKQGNDEIKYGIYLDENDNPQAVKLTTRHQSNGNAVTFEFGEESDGTQRMIELTPAFIDTMLKSKVYVVDEFDRSLHPQMSRKLMEMYLSASNPASKGQLIFTTHESNLLDLKLFRQDEIWFVEKNDNGATTAYSLSEFKPRYDNDIHKGYLQGRFGAIPFLANLDDLNWKMA